MEVCEWILNFVLLFLNILVSELTGAEGSQGEPIVYHGSVVRRRPFSVTFNRNFVKLTGNEDGHKISDEFEFGPGRTFHYGVIRP